MYPMKGAAATSTSAWWEHIRPETIRIRTSSWWDHICKKNHHHGGHDAEAQSPPFSLWNLLGYRDGANKKAIALLFLPDFLDVHDVSASR